MANKNFEVKHGLSVGGTERITSAGAGTLTNLTLSGNLTVNGTTVTLDATTLQVADKNIVLNYHASNDTSSAADGAGITIQDAVNGSTDATILWDATNDEFDFSHNVSIASSGDGLSLSRSGYDTYSLQHSTGNGMAIRNVTDSRNEMFFDSTGNVGVGTTSPSSVFEIAGSPQMLLHLNRATSTPGIKFTNGGSASGTYGYMMADENEFGFGYYDGSASSTKMKMSSDGDVSIGTTATLNRLTVSKASDISMSAQGAGQLRIEGNGYSGAIALNGDAMHIYQNSSARDIVMGNNETEQFRIDASGNVKIPGPSLQVADDITHLGDSDTYISFENDFYSMYAGGNRALDITSSYVIPKMNFHFAYNNIYGVTTTNDELGNGQGVLMLKQQISVSAGSKIIVWYDSGQILNNNTGGAGSANSNPQIAIYVTTNSSAPPTRGSSANIVNNTDHFMYPNGSIGAARIKMNGIGATDTLSSAGTYYIYMYGGSYNSGSYAFNYQNSSSNTRGASIAWAEVKA